jgi:hypothetical protein
MKRFIPGETGLSGNQIDKVLEYVFSIRAEYLLHDSLITHLECIDDEFCDKQNPVQLEFRLLGTC